MKDPARRTLTRLRAKGLSLNRTSVAIGRNPAFLQQFLERGSPRRLGELDRLHLAMHLGIDERRLGARDPWTPLDAR